MEKSYVDLLTLQERLKEGVDLLFPYRLWVKAEISELKRNASGHCYLDLSQSGRSGLVAKARAVIWASRYPAIDQLFRAETGSSLGKGMEILCRVQVSYHVLYGMTMTIDEVDAGFTLGEKELQKQRTLARLESEGLLNLQKRLRLPLLPYRLAVISAEGAAGYRDFCRHLTENEYGFAFDVRLFPAAMQGEGAPASMIQAIGEAVASADPFDAVLILRGGGSELDLSCFDDYDLACAIARCPIPVFTAIGHDKDFHVADRVANTYVKTPTALADLFLDCLIAEDQRLGALESRLLRLFTSRVGAMSSALDLQGSRLRLAVESRFQNASGGLDRLLVRVLASADGRLRGAGHALDRSEDRVSLARQSVLRRVDAALSSLLLTETRIRTTDPRSILRKGYVLALDRDGVKMASAAGSRSGDRVQMMFADGTLQCGVLDVIRRDNIPAEE